MADRSVHPVTPARWADLARFFENNGNPNYCWCQRWRLPSGEFSKLDSAARRDRLHSLVEAETPIGLLAYEGGEPVGWCSIAPRETYVAVERSRVIQRLDEEKTWAVVCLFIARTARGHGLTVDLLKAAADYAATHGAHAVEGYPVLKRTGSYRWMGSLTAFQAAGFSEASEPENGRVTMQRLLRDSKSAKSD